MNRCSSFAFNLCFHLLHQEQNYTKFNFCNMENFVMVRKLKVFRNLWKKLENLHFKLTFNDELLIRNENLPPEKRNHVTTRVISESWLTDENFWNHCNGFSQIQGAASFVNLWTGNSIFENMGSFDMSELKNFTLIFQENIWINCFLLALKLFDKT